MRALKKELIQLLLDLEDYKEEFDTIRIKKISQKFMDIYNQIHFHNKFNPEVKIMRKAYLAKNLAYKLNSLYNNIVENMIIETINDIHEIYYLVNLNII